MACKKKQKRFDEINEVIKIKYITSIIHSYDNKCNKKIWHQSKREFCYQHFNELETNRNIGICGCCKKIKKFRYNDISPKCMKKRWIVCGYVSSIINKVPSLYIDDIISKIIKNHKLIEIIKTKGRVPNWSIELHKTITGECVVD